MSLLENEETNELKDKTSIKKIKKDNYFDTREEEAVKRYLVAETKEEKEEIYNNFLRDPLNKMMILMLIRRF